MSLRLPRFLQSPVLLWTITAFTIAFSGALVVLILNASANSRSKLERDLAIANSETSTTIAALAQVEAMLVDQIEATDHIFGMVGSLESQNADLERDALTMRATIVALTTENESIGKQIADSHDQRIGLTDSLNEARADLDHARAENKQLSDALVDERTKLSQDNSDLQQRIDGLVVTNVSLGDTIQSLKEQNDALGRSLGGLQSKYETLTDMVEDVETLKATILALEEDIAVLEALRKPLVPLDVVETFPVCTGSMEPKITCMDSVVELRDFRPEDIIVGAVIAFYKPGDDPDNAFTSQVLHRVMGIKTEDSVRYFWTKGDANREPDGSWVPEGNVTAYVVSIIEDTRPENADLRADVNDARRRFYDFWDAWEAAEARYDEIALRYCGRVKPFFCSASEADFAKVERAFARYKTATADYNRASCNYQKLQHKARTESEPVDPFRIPPPFFSLACFSV